MSNSQSGFSIIHDMRNSQSGFSIVYDKAKFTKHFCLIYDKQKHTTHHKKPFTALPGSSARSWPGSTRPLSICT